MSILRLLVAALVLSSPALAENSVWMGLNYSVGICFKRTASESGKVPFPLEMRLPVYPYELMRAGISADVLVDLVVLGDGTVDSFEVGDITPSEYDAGIKKLLTKAVSEAVPLWNFEKLDSAAPSSKSSVAHIKCRISFLTVED